MYALIDDGAVRAVFAVPQKFETVECDESVVAGMIYSDGAFSDAELTTEQQILALEANQTARMLRQAALGDTESVEMLQAIEDEIALLRDQL